MIVKGKANINMLHKIKTKQLVRQMALRFHNFGTDVDCLRINASSSVELVMDVSVEQTDLFFIILILEMFLESHITFSLTTRCHLSYLFIRICLQYPMSIIQDTCMQRLLTLMISHRHQIKKTQCEGHSDKSKQIITFIFVQIL